MSEDWALRSLPLYLLMTIATSFIAVIPMLLFSLFAFKIYKSFQSTRVSFDFFCLAAYFISFSFIVDSFNHYLLLRRSVEDGLFLDVFFFDFGVSLIYYAPGVLYFGLFSKK